VPRRLLTNEDLERSGDFEPGLGRLERARKARGVTCEPMLKKRVARARRRSRCP
jgi:hypothetical protein